MDIRVASVDTAAAGDNLEMCPMLRMDLNPKLLSAMTDEQLLPIGKY